MAKLPQMIIPLGDAIWPKQNNAQPSLYVIGYIAHCSVKRKRRRFDELMSLAEPKIADNWNFVKMLAFPFQLIIWMAISIQCSVCWYGHYSLIL